MNVIVASLTMACVYGIVSKLWLRGQVALFTAPFGVLFSLFVIKLAGPIAFIVVKITIFVVVKIKLIVAKYLSVVIGGMLVNVMPGIGQIVSILVFAFLTLLLFGTIVEFYQWILSLFARALAIVRRSSDAISDFFEQVELPWLGLALSTAFEVALICYPSFVGFHEFVRWISMPPQGPLESIAMTVAGVAVAAFAHASYRKNTSEFGAIPKDYFDPRDLIETYFG
jgi:hypothetical protein